ncbi:sulfite exporter TauE/SafE family protein [Roseovarius sp. MBR-6]|uniref:sulfite exporter TauE/SafE family protein n=1 Tax=Roseovarius sp. MBR-6 TaxID=3156459 RepID=UPI0033993B61
MDPALLTGLALAVFGASMLQAATGIGYGVIAGPIFLVALNGAEAIQISTVHNFLIAILLVPTLRGAVERRVLGLLVLGGTAGIGAGLALQSALSVTALKLTAAAMVAFVALTLVADMRRARTGADPARRATTEVTCIGALAGIMGGLLAMPGPLAATWMSLRGFGKDAVRATILAFFIFAYGANTLSYVALSGFRSAALAQALILLPPLLIGVASGGVLARRLSEAVFRKVLLAVLTATVTVLLVSLW